MKANQTRRPLNHHMVEGNDKQPFFTRTHQDQAKKDDAFFQAKQEDADKNDQLEKEAESVGDKVQKKAEEEKDQPAVQKKDKEDEKPGQAAAGMDLEEQTGSVQKAEKKEEEKPVQKAQKEEEPPVQKMSSPGKDEEKPVQKKEAEDRPQEDAVMAAQEKGKPAAAAHKASIEDRLKQSKGKGMPLPDDVMEAMETEFQVDLSQVRIHTGQDAVNMNQELHSLAFTNGYDIYFNAGRYQPYTAAGKSLLAHELTHVVQQNAPVTKKPQKQ